MFLSSVLPHWPQTISGLGALAPDPKNNQSSKLSLLNWIPAITTPDLHFRLNTALLAFKASALTASQAPVAAYIFRFIRLFDFRTFTHCKSSCKASLVIRVFSFQLLIHWQHSFKVSANIKEIMRLKTAPVCFYLNSFPSEFKSRSNSLICSVIYNQIIYSLIVNVMNCTQNNTALNSLVYIGST